LQRRQDKFSKKAPGDRVEVERKYCSGNELTASMKEDSANSRVQFPGNSGWSQFVRVMTGVCERRLHLRIKLALGRRIRLVHSGFVTTKLQVIRKRLSPVLPLTHVLEQSGEREQVAAVCYRVRKLKIEFLLVRTRKGRWTFPKGGVMRGLTRAQSAALEAFEEGGVHGRIEQASFTRYILRKRRASQPAQRAIDAYLCEVLQLGAPQEVNRTPTWFTAEKAQLRLQEGRTTEDAGELARVVVRAVSRIERLNEQNGARSRTNIDPMQKVHFEAAENRVGGLIARVALLPYFRGKEAGPTKPPVIEFGADSRKILRLGPGRPLSRLPQ
jgi:8-oxo-dGTP pyrophosphatase MutT (NUDIX family)